MSNNVNNDTVNRKMIFGKILAPVKIGERANIRIGPNQVLQTSVVQHMIQYPSGKMEIQTRNSVYVIFPTD